METMKQLVAVPGLRRGSPREKAKKLKCSTITGGVPGRLNSVRRGPETAATTAKIMR